MRTSALAFALTLLIPDGVFAASGDNVFVNLKREAIITSLNIRLSDIADISTKGGAADDIGQIIVGAAPRAGYKTVLEQTQIARLLEQYQSTSGTAARIAGAEQVIVRSGAEQIAVEDYLQEAELALYRELIRNFTNVRLEAVGVYKPLHVPPGANEAKIVLPARILPARRMSVAVEVYHGNKLYLRIPVWFSVDARAVAYRLVESIPVGTILGEDMISADLVDISQLSMHKNVISDKRQVLGMQISQALQRGEIIYSSDVHQPLDVVAGQTVIVQVRQAGINLRATAVAVESGNKGRRIKLKSISSSELFEGVVVGQQLVESI